MFCIICASIASRKFWCKVGSSNKMKKIFAMFVLTFQIGTILPSGLGKCPIHLLMDNFNVSKIYGKWYEIQHSFYLPDLTFGCTTITLEPEEELNNVSQILITLKTVNQWTGNPMVINGVAQIESTNTPKLDFKFQTRMPSAVARFLPGSGLYQILDTDYKTFAILYSCTSYNFAYTDQIWLLAREFYVSDAALQETTKIINSWGLEASRMIKPKTKFCDENL